MSLVEVDRPLGRDVIVRPQARIDLKLSYALLNTPSRICTYASGFGGPRLSYSTMGACLTSSTIRIRRSVLHLEDCTETFRCVLDRAAR